MKFLAFNVRFNHLSFDFS